MLEIILKLLNENPEVAINLVHGYIEKYKPVVYGLGNECLEIAKDYVANFWHIQKLDSQKIRHLHLC
mgnify:CR=1 FL=1